MPTVSVIMPTYNQANFIRESMDSVLNQTLGDLELIVVNDCATDETADILNSYDDPRVRIISHKTNSGASAAMNTGFAEASGNYFTWLASDNLFHPTFLEKTVAYLEGAPDADLVYTCFDNIDENSRFLSYHFLEPYTPGLLQVNPGCIGGAFLYTRRLAAKVGQYEPLISNDLDYWLRAAREHKFGFIPEVLASNRKHPGMLTVKKRERLAREVNECLEREAVFFSGDFPLQERITNLRRAADQFCRAITLSLKDRTATDGMTVIDDGLLASAIVELLRNDGLQASICGLDDVSHNDDRLFVPLLKEHEVELRSRSCNALALDQETGKRFGLDF